MEPRPLLSELEQHRVENLLSQFYARRVLAHVQHEVRLGHTVRGDSVTLFEFRPRLNEPSDWLKSPVAQFRLDARNGLWSLYWHDRNRRWRLYDACAPATNFERLLAEVDHDPTHIFWG